MTGKGDIHLYGRFLLRERRPYLWGHGMGTGESGQDSGDRRRYPSGERSKPKDGVCRRGPLQETDVLVITGVLSIWSSRALNYEGRGEVVTVRPCQRNWEPPDYTSHVRHFKESSTGRPNSGSTSDVFRRVLA